MKNILLAIFLFASLNAKVDISYCVADLKFSQEHGIKICEIQHGILSTFYADVYLNGGNGAICPKIAEVFAEFPLPKWAAFEQISFPHLAAELKDWQNLVIDSDFLELAQQVPSDPNCIESYYGMVYARKGNHKYPGIITIDAATHPYWIDKYKMSLLFTYNPELSRIKPEWNNYKKNYTEKLAKRIQKDLKGDTFVIKPRGAFLGKGVIITSDLDNTLNFILNQTDELKFHPDPSYNHWYNDKFDSFIVEKYYPSDLIQVDNKTYDPTMRIAFFMIYNNEKIDVRFIGGYWMLPFKAIDEPGTLNETRKAYCKIPYFIKATDETINEVRRQIEQTIPLLYQEMLEGN